MRDRLTISTQASLGTLPLDVRLNFLRDRLMVGHAPLKGGIGVRVPVPQQSFAKATRRYSVAMELRRIASELHALLLHIT